MSQHHNILSSYYNFKMLCFPMLYSIMILLLVLASAVGRFDSIYWMAMAEQAINVIYTLAEHPDVIVAGVIKHIASVLKNFSAADTGCHENVDADGDVLVGESTGAENAGGSDHHASKDKAAVNTDGIMTRLLSVAGHVALKQLVHTDGAILSEMKRRNAVQEGSKPDDKGRKKGNTTTSDETASSSKKVLCF